MIKKFTPAHARVARIVRRQVDVEPLIFAGEVLVGRLFEFAVRDVGLREEGGIGERGQRR